LQADVAVIGAGVVGAAAALELARRGAEVVVVEANDAPALEASGTSSGILHTGFDSSPGELETQLILRAARIRDPLLEVLSVPVLRCGAEVRPQDGTEREAVARLAANARRNDVEARLGEDGVLEVPGEAITDPVAFTLAMLGAAERHGAELRTGFPVESVDDAGEGLRLEGAGGGLDVAVAINCAGLGGGRVAALAGDRSFEVYPRKGEFLVFDPVPGEALERILLPVPSEGTKGVLVFPTIDGKVIAGPTAVDLDRADWSVRPEARQEILPKAAAMFPPLAGREPTFAYAGLRPAGRGVNYLIARSSAQHRLINAAAIRSTGLTASVAIGEHLASLAGEAGISLGDPAPLERAGAPPVGAGPWWRQRVDRLGA
jgi:glycerol-3-phosphate dehydrogenase